MKKITNRKYFDSAGKMDMIPQCPSLGCGTPMGLRIRNHKALWVCPQHGTQMWVELYRLNGVLDQSKIGGTDV